MAIELTERDFAQTELLKGFTSGGIDGIYFKRIPSLFLQTYAFLLCRLTPITAVHIDFIAGEPDEIHAQTVAAFNSCPNLTELDTSIFVDGSFLSKIDRAKQLQTLTLINVPVSDSTCISVSQCTNLEKLTLTGSTDRNTSSPVNLDPLAKLKNLKVLRLGVIRFGPTVQNVLQQCRELKEVALSINKPLTRDQTMTLRRAAPHAVIAINSGVIEARYDPLDGTKP